MSMITLEVRGPIVFVITTDDGLSHRRPIEPGTFDISGTWVQTDVSAESAEVQAACASTWTSEVISAWQLAHPYAAPPPPTLPDLLPYQFRAMLTLSGKMDALNAFIAALPDPQKTIAQSKLEYSLAFERKNDLVLAAQQALGLTDDQLDALWTQAAAIS